MLLLLNLFRWTLLLIGIVYLITQADIVSVPRVWFAKKNVFFLSLIYCPACTGFWVGLVLGATGLWPWEDDPLWFAIACSSISAMAVAKTWDSLTGGNDAYGIELPLLGLPNGEAEENGRQETDQ